MLDLKEPRRLSATKTPIKEHEFYDAIGRLAPELSHAAKCVLMAHWALETGRGKKCVAYNVGNFKHSQHSNRDYCYFQTWEVLPVKEARKYVSQSTMQTPCKLVEPDGGVRVTRINFLPDHPACCFNAYETLDAGLKDYIEVVRRRFGDAWRALEKGDPWEFATALHAKGYFTADVGIYSKSIASLWREYHRDFAD